MEFLKESVPRLGRVAVFGTSTRAGHCTNLKETELAAAAFRVKLQFLDVRIPRRLRVYSEREQGAG